MKNSEVDVFVISYNRLKYLKRLIAWLEAAGFERIHIVDNASTYPPLLAYLDRSPHRVHRLEKNYGHLAVWRCGRFDDILRHRPYIVTDNDVLPIEACPHDVTECFLEILDQYPHMTKVGFGLKIDDLPDCYAHRETVIEWERQFWEKRLEDGLYDASIDTTFALYRPGIYPSSKKWWRSIRTGHPYLVRHLPWYEDSGRQDEEDIYYQDRINRESSFWSVTDPDLLRKHQAELRAELGALYASKRWRMLQIGYQLANLIVRGDRFARRIGRKDHLLSGFDGTPAELQRRNKALTVEIGSIRSSGAWRLLERFRRKTADS